MEALDKVLEQIQAQGERLTIQRRLVLEALCCQRGHQTIAQIRERIQANGHDLPEPTIYRILQWLKDRRVISQTDMGEASVVYELITTPPHHHLICLNCGKVIEVDDQFFATLRQSLRDCCDFEPRIEHMAIYGTCADCAGG